MSQAPTPRDAAPAVERRKELVAEAMARTEDLDGMSTAEQLARLDEVATLLAGVLHNSVNQLGIPGVQPAS